MRALYVPSVFREFDRFFNETPQMTWQRDVGFGEYDWRETDRGYLLSVDVPGMGPDDIKIEARGNLLSISGERKFDEKGENRSRRFFGKFERSFELPSEAELDSVEARYEKGVLELFVPKQEKAKAKLIKVNTTGESLLSKLLPRSQNA